MTTRHPPLSHVPPTGCHPMDNGNLDVTKLSRRICVRNLSDVSGLWAKRRMSTPEFGSPKVARRLPTINTDFAHTCCTACGGSFHTTSPSGINQISQTVGILPKKFSIISAWPVDCVGIQLEGCASRVDQSSLLSPSSTTARGWMARKFPRPSKIHWCSGG